MPDKITGKFLNEKWRVGARHALYHHAGSWYHQLTAFPGALFDSEGYVLFPSKDDYRACRFLRINKDPGVLGRIQDIPGYVRHETNAAIDIAEPLSPGRIEQRVSRIIRNTLLGSELKLLHDHRCQMCGEHVELLDGLYSEAHHIRPLGSGHDGTDSQDNILCVCPNCHVLLDYTAISIDLPSLAVLKHDINNQNIDYHNALHSEHKAKCDS